MEERKMKHVPSQMLSQEANDKVFTLLEARTQALCTAFVSVVISKPPERPDWKPYRSGIATLVKDHNRKSYYVQIYDIVDWEKVREEELAKGTPYHVSLPTFHQFEAAKGKAMGLKFSLEKEAKTFAQIARDITMTGHYKSDNSSLIINANDKRSTGDTPEVKTVPSAPPPLRANQNKTMPRLQRPKSMLREAPRSPPPPPPISTKNASSSNTAFPSPPEPPPPRSTGVTSLPSTPVNKDAPLSLSGALPLRSPVTTAPPLPPTLNRKKKITKDMIGVPTNFQHVSHIGFDPEVTLDDKMLKDMMTEPVGRPSVSHPLPPPHTAPPPPPDKRSLSLLPVSQAFSPRQESAATVVSDKLSREEEMSVCEEPSNRSLVHSPVSEASPPQQEEVTTLDSDENCRGKEETSVCEDPSNRSLAHLPVSEASPPWQEEAATVDPDKHLREEETSVREDLSNRILAHLPVSQASPPRQEEAATADSEEQSREEETSVCEEPNIRSSASLPVSQVSPPRQEEATTIDSGENSIEKEETSVCEEPRELVLDTPPNLLRENASEVQTNPLIEESEIYTENLETSANSKNDHIVNTSNSIDGNDLVTECNSELEIAENITDSDPAQSLMVTPDSTINSNQISVTDLPSLLEVDSTKTDPLAVRRSSSLDDSDQNHQRDQNEALSTMNYNPSLQANESCDYDTEILNSLNELEAMLEGVSTSSSESEPSQTKTESLTHAQVKPVVSEDDGEETTNNNNQSTNDIQSSCESFTCQSNTFSTTVYTNDPASESHDAPGHSTFSTTVYTNDPASESHDAPGHTEMNEILENSTTHSNLVLSAENLQIPQAPTRNRRKKSKQASPPPPPPTPTEPEELKSSYL